MLYKYILLLHIQWIRLKKKIEDKQDINQLNWTKKEEIKNEVDLNKEEKNIWEIVANVDVRIVFLLLQLEFTKHCN